MFWAWPRGASESIIVCALHDTTGVVNAPAYAAFATMEPKLSSAFRMGSILSMTQELESPKGYQYVAPFHVPTY